MPCATKNQEYELMLHLQQSMSWECLSTPSALYSYMATKHHLRSLTKIKWLKHEPWESKVLQTKSTWLHHKSHHNGYSFVSRVHNLTPKKYRVIGFTYLGQINPRSGSRWRGRKRGRESSRWGTASSPGSLPMRAGGPPGRRSIGGRRPPLRCVPEEMMQPASRTEKRAAASPAHGVAHNALLQSPDAPPEEGWSCVGTGKSACDGGRWDERVGSAVTTILKKML